MSSPTSASQKLQLHVLIVGGGIAGLAAARALKKCGHRVEIFERSAFSNEVGAAVTISPNGTRVLQELGFDFKKGGGVRQQHLRMFNAKDLSSMFDHDYGDVESLCGAPWEAMHRRDLHGALYDLALREDDDSQVPVKLHARSLISRVDTESATIELEDGRKFSGDLLIGADGLRSVVRSSALGEQYPPIDTEWQIYRFLLPREAIMNDPLTREMKMENTRIMYEIPDDTEQSKVRVVWYECRNGEVQNWAGFYRGDRNETKIEDFGQPASKEKFLDLFAAVSPKLEHIFRKAGEIIYWRIYERMPLPTFIYGRTLLIGDAGHPMTPFTAQGANQALEDAGALLGLFSNITSKNMLAQRLAMYDKVRLVRATRIQTGASRPYKNGDPNPLTKAHEELLEKDEYMPAELKAKSTFDPDRQKWDFRYNVFEKCEEVLREGISMKS